MASSANFTLAGSTLESSSITLLSGEVCRARFTAVTGSGGRCFVITRGGVETVETIDSDEIAYSSALAGDAVKVRMIDWKGASLSGVLETIAA